MSYSMCALLKEKLKTVAKIIRVGHNFPSVKGWSRRKA